MIYDNITNKKLSCYVGNEWMDLNVYNQYDDNGNITSSGYDGEESYTYYTYDNNNQLLRADNEYYGFTAVYTYDDRGNITSKNKYSFTRDEITSNPKASTVYSYNNEKWLDQLTAVNGTPLTYDANGNLASYGDTTYTWSHGKWLSSITDADNTYSYTYDENGVRSSKTVNGVKTEFNTFNGLLLSQKTGNDFIYFQYDTNGTPIGFVYNDAQYLYMTNQLGDVISITDAQGKEIIEYEYDEWGSMLDITLKSDDEIVSTLAELNPLRYRGYYYDNETGMYYLQSRYYNPEWGRFISADSFVFINNYTIFWLNAYAYCNNNPVFDSDPQGTKSVDKETKNWMIKRYTRYLNSMGYSYIYRNAESNNYKVTVDSNGIISLTGEHRFDSGKKYYNSVFIYGTQESWYNEYQSANQSYEMWGAAGESFAELAMIPQIIVILIMVLTGTLILAIRYVVVYEELQNATARYNASKRSGYYEFIQTLSVTTYKKGEAITEYIID